MPQRERNWGLLLMIDSRTPTTAKIRLSFSPSGIYLSILVCGRTRKSRLGRFASLFGFATAPARGFDLLFGRLENAEVARVEPARNDNTFRRQAAFQELSNGGGAARHSFVETPIVERRQLLVRQHDLKRSPRARAAMTSPPFWKRLSGNLSLLPTERQGCQGRFFGLLLIFPR